MMVAVAHWEPPPSAAAVGQRNEPGPAAEALVGALANMAMETSFSGAP